MQTTYNDKPAAAFNGMSAEGPHESVRSALNDTGVDCPFGIFVKKGDTDENFDLFSSGATALGALMHSHAQENRGLASAAGVANGDMANVLRKGKVWMLTEGTVTANGKVYARHTSDGASNTQKGKPRADGDVSAQQVTTVTPTAASTTLYTLTVFVDGKLYSFQVTSDGDGTATEICDAFRTAMQANTAFNALVASTGTATLILTGTAALSAEFQVADGGSPGVLAVAATTAFAKRADEVPGARYLTSTSGAGLALVEVNLP